MLAFGKLVDLGSAALHVSVMHQNISKWLTVDHLIAYKVLPTASHIYFYQQTTTLACVLGNVHLCTLCPITFVNAPLFPDIYFVCYDQ